MLSDRFLLINDNLYSSRSSHELNEQVFEEYNSNNNEEERIKKVFEMDSHKKVTILHKNSESTDTLKEEKMKYSSFMNTNESNKDFNPYAEIMENEFLKESL